MGLESTLDQSRSLTSSSSEAVLQHQAQATIPKVSSAPQLEVISSAGSGLHPASLSEEHCKNVTDVKVVSKAPVEPPASPRHMPGESPMTSLSGSCSSVCSGAVGTSRPATPHRECHELRHAHCEFVVLSACASPSDGVVFEAEDVWGGAALVGEAPDNAADQRVSTLADTIASDRASFQSRLEFADLQCAKALQENERLRHEVEASRGELAQERRFAAAARQREMDMEARHRADRTRAAAAAKAKTVKDGVARARLSEQLAAADLEIRTFRGDDERLRALSVEELGILSEKLAGALVCVQREHRSKILEREDEHLCSVCMTERKDSLLQPCHHLALCSACSARVQQCPQCRSTITGRLRVYT